MAVLIEIKWKRQWGDPDEIVWIDVQKLNANWSMDETYLGSDAATTDDLHFRYNRFGEWLLEHIETEYVCMPHVGLDETTISFSDGRHRFAWCRDHGVKHLPVTAPPGMDAQTIKKLVGTDSRISLLPGPE